MSNIDIFSMALRNLTKRKLRSFLTILGVVVGAAAIIVMLSFGIAINITFQENLESMGDVTTINVVDPNKSMMFYYDDSSSQSNNKNLVLNDKTVDTFKKLENVIAVTPIMEMQLYAKSGKFQGYPSLKGIDPAAMEAFGFVAAEGNLLSGKTKNEIVFGSDSIYDFYNPNDRGGGYIDWENREAPIDVLNDKIEMSYSWDALFQVEDPFMTDTENSMPKAKTFVPKVSGILEPNGINDNYYVFMDIKEVQKLYLEQQKYEQDAYSQSESTGKAKKRISADYSRIMLKVSDINAVESVKKVIEEDGYKVENVFQYMDSMKEMLGSLQLMLGAIGGVSLFVAAIGIANTMVMAIYERTKEIGVMKVIGASIKDIKKLFLLEAALIGFTGGALGVLLSLGVSALINNVGISFFQEMAGGMGSKVSVIPAWLCGLALVFSAAIGLISGYFPARRAMKLSALKAIRSE